MVRGLHLFYVTIACHKLRSGTARSQGGGAGGVVGGDARVGEASEVSLSRMWGRRTGRGWLTTHTLSVFQRRCSTPKVVAADRLALTLR